MSFAEPIWASGHAAAYTGRTHDRFRAAITLANSLELSGPSTQELAGLMEGSIGVISSAGAGSTFWLEVPFATADPGAATDRDRQSRRLDGINVLIVDDASTNIEVLSRQLQGFGMLVSAARDGFEALAEMERAWFKSRPYDLVLLDQVMPGLDGSTLAQLVRHNPNLARTRLILLSASPRRQGAGVDGGLDAVLEKPIREAELLDALGRLFNVPKPVAAAAREAARPARTEPPKPRRRLQVLVAEDNRINQQVVQVLLNRAGHGVSLAQNGFEAVEAVRDRHFDVVLMDVQMPGMGGVEATRLIRALPEPSRSVPIIAVTADAMAGAMEQYIAAGMDFYLSKPVRTQELLARLDAIAAADPSLQASNGTASVL